jgi:hypothetical protein
MSALRVNSGTAREMGVTPGAYFPRKSLKRASFSDVFRRQNCGNQIRLRPGVNFIQMTLRFGQS